MGITAEKFVQNGPEMQMKGGSPVGRNFMEVINRHRDITEARANTGGSKFEQWFSTKNVIKAASVIAALGLTAGLADAVSAGVAGGIGTSVHNNILQPIWEIAKFPFKGATLEPIRKEGIFQLPPHATPTGLTKAWMSPDIAKLGPTEKARVWAATPTGGPVYRFIGDLMTKLKVGDPAGIAQNTTEFAGGITTAFTGDTLGGYTDYKYSGKLLPVTALVGGIAALKAVKPIERYKQWAGIKEARAGVDTGFAREPSPVEANISQLKALESAFAAPAGPA